MESVEDRHKVAKAQRHKVVKKQWRIAEKNQNANTTIRPQSDARLLRQQRAQFVAQDGFQFFDGRGSRRAVGQKRKERAGGNIGPGMIDGFYRMRRAGPEERLRISWADDMRRRFSAELVDGRVETIGAYLDLATSQARSFN